jgi:enoyl-CoA hydratase/carnithine racemase
MPEVKIGIPSVVEAALLPRLMGSGRAAWMVLTGEPIDARRAYEWGLIEKVSANLEGDVDALVKQIVSNDRKALRLQKELLQRWEEAPLSTSVAASLLAFREAHRK